MPGSPDGVPGIHSRSRKFIKSMQVFQTNTGTSVLPETLPTFRVGNIPVYGDAILAPMDGFSDWPFRSICRALGSAMSYNEFTRAEFIVNAFEHIADRFTYDEAERPFVIQVYGDDPELIIAAALRVRRNVPTSSTSTWAARHAPLPTGAQAWG